ncbi:optineurin isoform X1 [Sphaerodactylus townsendi]|uniref:optineurin isoform X1 n=1 Tax=Sphaerodactylus townsendi TaxID=933632 RepID=UPI0020273248|nr:optineurin isoform X1 [Sphaerodactylus townsendi]XP_048357870.1 optineurin isoform X1 [Sphaerodactylus townsendi]
MSKKVISCPTENGQCNQTEVENGHLGRFPPAGGTNSVEEMVQQMKELITENNELKEAMRQRNQAMKNRFEELSVWREKLKEEREFYESKFKEARQCLAAKCVENDMLKKQLQTVEGFTNEYTVSQKKMTQELEQLKVQVTKLQAEKADLVAIISELQLKMNGTTTEDSFVEIRMHEGEISGVLKENPELNGKKKGDSATNMQFRMETEADHLLERGTQTEQEEENDTEPIEESMGNEVETLNLQVSALFKELQETHAKLTEAELIQKKLQEKCQVLERKHCTSVGDLDEKQQLLYTIKKLELQVESMQSEIKLEQAKTNEEKVKFNKLQEAYSKLLPELTIALKAAEDLKAKEAEMVDKAVVEEMAHKVELAERALAAKQLQIDQMKQTIAKQEEELETVAVLQAQMEVYCSDFHAERAAREKIHGEKEQLAVQLAYLLAEKHGSEDLSRNSLAELQTRHGARVPSGQHSVAHLNQEETEDQVWQQRNIPKHSCPKCGVIFPDIDTLQIHVMDCII